MDGGAPPGFIEYMDGLGPDGTYGRWLRTKPVVARVGDSILLHGGLDPAREPTDLDEINKGARRELQTYDRYPKQLVARGIILPFFTFQETTEAIQQELNYWLTLLAPEGPPAPNSNVSLDRNDTELIQTLLALQNDVQISEEDGPVWFRGFARWDEREGLQLARSLTERYGVTRFVVGHTIPPTRLITPLFEDRVFLIDTGMVFSDGDDTASAVRSDVAGQASALEIEGNRVTAVYLARRQTLVQ